MKPFINEVPMEQLAEIEANSPVRLLAIPGFFV